MATANFLEEALNTDVDESAVNAIVGSLETQLVTQSSQINQNQSINVISSVQSSAINLNFNGNLTYNNNSNNLNSTTLTTTTTSQKNYALPNVTTFSTTSSANSTQLKTINNNNNNNNSNTFASQYQQHLNTLSQQQNNNNNNNIPNSPATIANTITSIRMPKNEPVKVAYPASSQQSSPAVLTMNNNRVTFTSAAPLQNGTITLSQLTSQQNQQQTAGSGGAVMQSNVANIKITGTSIAATGQPQQTLVFKNASSAAPVFTSSTPGIMTMSKTVNNQTTTPNLVTQLPTNLQIVNVRAPGQQSAQKTTNVGQQPTRVMIPHNMIRHPNSTISLQQLQGIPAQAGSTLLLKSDNGQFQLLRIGPAPTSGTQITPGLTSTGNQTIRLQTVPAVSRFTGPPLALRKTIVTQQSITPHSSSTSTIIVNPSTTTSTASQQQIISAQSTPIVSAVPALTSTQQSQQTSQQTIQQQQSNATTVVVTSNPALQQQPTQNANSGTTTVTGSGASVVVTQQPPIRNDNTKEKCRKFLTNLIELSKREPSNVEKNVRTLIQELVDANVEPEEFCKKLERLLNASPQPCLIGFLKKSLPLLRQSLVTKEIIIEGINPPSPSVAFSGATITTTQIPAQIRPIGQTVMSTGNIGQTQIRMVTPSPRIGQTTIRQTTPIRIQTGGSQVTTPRLTTPIRAGQTIVQTNSLNQTQGIPALQPVSNTILSGTTQIRTPATITRPQTTVQIRQTTPIRPVSQTNQKNIIITSPSSVVGQKTQLTGTNASAGNAAANVVANATASIQLKQTATTNNIILNNNIANSNNNNNSNLNVNISNNSNLIKNNSQYIANSSTSTTATATQIVINSNKSNNKLLNSNSNNLPTVNSKSIAITSHVVSSSSSLHHTSISHSNASVHNNKTIHDKKSQNLSAGTTIKQVREKQDKKFGASLNATGSLNSGSGGATAAMVSAYYPTIYGDDDINDVAAMGGVNLAEESQRILGSTEFVGTQIRSCKDEVFLNLPALQQKIRACMAKHGLDEPSTDVAVLLSHATQEHLKNVVEKLAVIAEHRIDILKIDPRYEMTTDVRGQIKFLEELDKAEQKRHEEYEREMLLRAAKSRSKTEDPEQAKLKAKAKEMQRAEMEELRHREANNTALQAIGPRKKPKLDTDAITSATGTSGINTSNKTTSVPRPRIKRVNLRDMIFYLEQEKDSNRNNMLYKAYLK